MAKFCPGCRKYSVGFDTDQGKLVCNSKECGYTAVQTDYQQHINGLKAANKIPE